MPIRSGGSAHGDAAYRARWRTDRYADGKNITVMRTEGGQTRTFKFNYKDVSKGKNLAQNIAVNPGDTVVVP